MVEEKLKVLGLNDTEIKLYLIIFKKQRISPYELSKESGVKRPTVYAAVSELIRLGLIEEDDTGKNKIYIGLTPQQFNNIILNQKIEIGRKEKIVEKLITELEDIPRIKDFTIPETKVVEGEGEVVRFLYKKSPFWVESMLKINEDTWWGFQNDIFFGNKSIQKWVDYYWKNVAKNTHLKLLVNHSETEEGVRGKYKKRNIKFFDNINFTSTQWVIGEYVINITFKNNKFYLVEIKDKNLASNLRDMFKFLYNLD